MDNIDPALKIMRPTAEAQVRYLNRVLDNRFNEMMNAGPRTFKAKVAAYELIKAAVDTFSPEEYTNQLYDLNWNND